MQPNRVRIVALFLALAATVLLAGCGGGGGVPADDGDDGGGGGGGGGGGTGNPPTGLLYASPSETYGTETTITPNAPTWSGGDPTAFTVAPALPGGLSLDPTTGVVSGTTTTAFTPATSYAITASNADGSANASVQITVGPIAFLAAGFDVEVVADGLLQPVKIALAADGKVFFNELGTGNTRLLLADGTLQSTPFAQNTVLTGGHNGLLGLALHPEFASNGYVYVVPCTAGTGPLLDRIQVKRYQWVSGQDAGQGETVVVDDLPVGSINNGGDIVFGLEGPPRRFYLTLGDTTVPALAQTDGSRAGRLLRYADDGTIPADNPITNDPEWCRGLRNTFGIAVHPTTGYVFGVDNGDLTDDELNFLFQGKNFEWGGLPPGFPGQDIGTRVRVWPRVIVPTALAWHDGTGWGSEFANDIFLTSYTDENVQRFQMSGLGFVDIDLEEVVLTFVPEGGDNKPLDIERASDGSLYVSTFSAVYRLTRP